MRESGDSPRRLRIVFICQAVDLDDPVVPTTVRWIESLAGTLAVERVAVLALRTGRHRLPANVHVERFGRSNKLTTLVGFYMALVRSLRPRPDLFFVYQGGAYPLLLLPFKLLRRIPIVQWKAHSFIGRAMAFYARYCDDLILTSARAAFPLELPKVRVLGQGVDTELFRVEDRPPRGDLIAVGRISPVKRSDQIVRAVTHANRTNGTHYTLDLFGPTYPADEVYLQGLEALIDDLGARDWVTLHGAVTQEQLPGLLNGYRASVNFSTGAVDKTAVEAMACGLPVVSSNDAFAEIIPDELHPILVADKQSTDAQAKAIHLLLGRSDAEIRELGGRLRSLVVSEHSIDYLTGRVVEEVETLLERRR